MTPGGLGMLAPHPRSLISGCAAVTCHFVSLCAWLGDETTKLPAEKPPSFEAHRLRDEATDTNLRITTMCPPPLPHMILSQIIMHMYVVRVFVCICSVCMYVCV